ncbi:MAG: restriction endonuclease subunit S, partial [Patescibacteria group bacterium]|nr:restriction endonuclease subunit S [Patescibacteria group bacterium]
MVFYFLCYITCKIQVCIGSTIGKIAVLEIEGCTNQQINAVICHDKALSFFYFYSMLYFNEKQFRKETGLQAVPIVNKSRFSYFELPTIDKQES